MIHKVTVQKSWKSDDEKLIFFQDPELMCFSSDTELVKYAKVGSWFWAKLKEPAQGKKAYRILEEYGETEPTQEEKEAAVKPTISGEGKNRSFALSYAKDIACAKIRAGKQTSAYDVLDVAVLFEAYLDSGAVVKKKSEEG